jgi:hypothetical protein
MLCSGSRNLFDRINFRTEESAGPWEKTDTKSPKPVTVLWPVPEARRRAAIPGPVGPRAATNHPQDFVFANTYQWIEWIANSIDACLVGVLIPAIAAPFPHIAVHVVQTERVWFL